MSTRGTRGRARGGAGARRRGRAVAWARLLFEAGLEGENVGLVDLAPLWLLAQHAHLAARERLQRHLQLLLVDARRARYLGVPAAREGAHDMVGGKA